MIGTCITCKKEFKFFPYRLNVGGGKYCSRECRKTGKYIKCIVCEKAFYAKPAVIKKGAKYCSDECRRTGKYIPCKYCGKIRYIELNIIKRGEGLYCNRSCLGKDKTGKQAKHWKGGVVSTKDGNAGYLHERQGRHYIRQHRTIVESFTGRKLKRYEVVHHINGIRTDNRIQNLYLFKNNSEHISYHFNVLRGHCEKITKSNLI